MGSAPAHFRQFGFRIKRHFPEVMSAPIFAVFIKDNMHGFPAYRAEYLSSFCNRIRCHAIKYTIEHSQQNRCPLRVVEWVCCEQKNTSDIYCTDYRRPNLLLWRFLVWHWPLLKITWLWHAAIILWLATVYAQVRNTLSSLCFFSIFGYCRENATAFYFLWTEIIRLRE